MLDFWINYLENPTLSVLPHDFLKPENNRSVEAVKLVTIGVKPDFVTGLAVLAALIYRLTGDDDVVIATDAEARGEPFIVRLTVDAKMLFKQLEEKVRHEFDINQHKVEYHNLDDISQAIMEKRGLDSRPPLFKISYQYARDSQKLETSVKGSVRD